MIRTISLILITLVCCTVCAGQSVRSICKTYVVEYDDYRRGSSNPDTIYQYKSKPDTSRTQYDELGYAEWPERSGENTQAASVYSQNESTLQHELNAPAPMIAKPAFSAPIAYTPKAPGFGQKSRALRENLLDRNSGFSKP